METCFVIKDNTLTDSFICDPNLLPLLFKTREAAETALRHSFLEDELADFEIIEVDIHK